MNSPQRNHSNNGHHRQTFAKDAKRMLKRKKRRSGDRTKQTNPDAVPKLQNQPPLAPEWSELNNATNTVAINTQENGKLEFTNASNSLHEPDFWNVAIVGVLSTFYLASLVSTYVSTSLLLYLLSGGAGIAIPLFGTQIAITEAVALMGTGILEGTSLSDAYLDHKKLLTGNRQWISRFGRFMAFVAQGLLYYMALGQLLFATADVSSLGTQGLSDQQSSSDSQAAMVLEPPTVLHGAFVGTISFAWSFGTTYIGPTALLVAIDRLRRKQIQKTQQSPENQTKVDEQTNIQPLLNYWHDQISKEIQFKLYNKLIEHQVEELKLLQRAIDRGLVEIANLPEQVRRYGLSIAQNTPKELLEKAKLTPAQAAKIFQQPIIASLPTNVAKNPQDQGKSSKDLLVG
jgi:hypothetical protein